MKPRPLYPQPVQMSDGQLKDFKCTVYRIVPDTRTGRCLEPDGNGVSSKRGEGGVREGQAPQTRREISSQLPARKEVTWSRRKKERRVRRNEEEPACTE
jgi:hypothetical protein